MFKLKKPHNYCEILKFFTTISVIVLLYILILIKLFPTKYEFSISADHEVYYEPESEYPNEDLTDVYEVLWWDHNSKYYNVLPDCGNHLCRFSANQGIMSEAKVVILNAFDVELKNLPLPRPPNQIWAFYYDESPMGSRYLSSPVFLQHFNFSSTLNRHSSFPMLNALMPSYVDLISHTYLKSPAAKSKLNLAPVLFLNSNCNTTSRREYFVKELMEFIQVDSYGKCLHNKNQSDSVYTKFRHNYYGADQLHLIGSYKFVIAIENGCCFDYVTEKYWRPLVAGSIPIYWGSPTIRDWQPNNKSAIYVNDFRDAKMLADFLHTLNNNDTEYMSYLSHKLNQRNPITNQRLKKQLLVPTHKKGRRAFECWLCEKVHNLEPGKVYRANIDHYNCPVPQPTLPLMKTYDFDQYHVMCEGQCQAQVFHYLFSNNINISKTQFQKLVAERMRLKLCDRDVRCT